MRLTTSPARHAIPLLSLLTPSSLALPQDYTVTAAEIAAKNPFTNASWPLPHNITGDDQAGQNTPTQGWGGIHLHDPSLVLGPDGHYWSFSTHGLVAISRASKRGSLSGYWAIQGSILVNSSIIKNSGSTDPWAPDVHLANGQYHCYYAVSQFGSQYSSIGLATSKSLKPGTWTDHGAVITSAPDAEWPLNITNAIDGNYFRDPNTGNEYLTYGSFWDDIFQFELKDGLKNVTYKSTPNHLSLDPVSPQAEEGSYLSFHDGWYYLWFSHGICCGYNPNALPAPGEEYSIRVGRSRSPTGPFVDMNNVDLTNGGGYIVFGSHGYVYGPGGQGVISGYEGGRDVLYYHYINIYYDPSYQDDLKLLGWNYIEYVNGWPVLKY